MQATDTHHRYFHPHYVVTVKLFIQADGSILVIQGNVRMEVTPTELLSMLDGLIDLASVYSVLHDRLSDVTIDRIVAESKEG